MRESHPGTLNGAALGSTHPDPVVGAGEDLPSVGTLPHVLMLVSWYMSSSSPTAGVFFRDQAEAMHMAGLTVGVAFPESRRLRTISLRAPVENHWQVVEHHLGGFATLRLAGWNPGWARVRSKAYLAGAERLTNIYSRTFGTPDIIHAQSTLWGGVAAARISDRLGIPFIITEHSSAFERGILRSWEVPMAAAALRQASAVLAVSDSLAGRLREFAPGLEVEVVPNMVDTEFFSPGPRNHAASPYVFLCVGGLVPIKRFDIAIRAFAAAFQGNPGIVLRIGGSGPEASRLAGLAGRLGIADRVQLIGGLSRAQVRDEMRSADAFVLSSSVETFGLVVAEAQSVGLPVIVTECGGPAELVSETTGIRVAVDNADDLSRAMLELYERRGEWGQRAASIRATARGRFERDVVAQRILGCYQRVLGRQPTAPIDRARG
jgi:glycosyltransferase involved in cell wall biosynthesis